MDRQIDRQTHKQTINQSNKQVDILRHYVYMKWYAQNLCKEQQPSPHLGCGTIWEDPLKSPRFHRCSACHWAAWISAPRLWQRRWHAARFVRFVHLEVTILPHEGQELMPQPDGFTQRWTKSLPVSRQFTIFLFCHILSQCHPSLYNLSRVSYCALCCLKPGILGFLAGWGLSFGQLHGPTTPPPW